MTLAVWVTYWLRFENSSVVATFQPECVPNLGNLLLTFIMGAPILLVYLRTFGLYDVYRHSRLLDQGSRASSGRSTPISSPCW